MMQRFIDELVGMHRRGAVEMIINDAEEMQRLSLRRYDRMMSERDILDESAVVGREERAKNTSDMFSECIVHRFLDFLHMRVADAIIEPENPMIREDVLVDGHSGDISRSFNYSRRFYDCNMGDALTDAMRRCMRRIKRWESLGRLPNTYIERIVYRMLEYCMTLI